MSKERWRGILIEIFVGIPASIVAAVVGSLMSGVLLLELDYSFLRQAAKTNRARQNTPRHVYAPIELFRGRYQVSRSNQVE